MAKAKKKSAQPTFELDTVSWLLEFIPDIKQVKDDTLRTWFVYGMMQAMVRQPESFEFLYQYLYGRWVSGVDEEFWTATQARQHINKWYKAILIVMRHGRSSIVLPGKASFLGPTRTELAVFKDGLLTIVAKLKKTFRNRRNICKMIV